MGIEELVSHVHSSHVHLVQTTLKKGLRGEITNNMYNDNLHGDGDGHALINFGFEHDKCVRRDQFSKLKVISQAPVDRMIVMIEDLNRSGTRFEQEWQDSGLASRLRFLFGDQYRNTVDAVFDNQLRRYCKNIDDKHDQAVPVLQFQS